MKFTKADRTAKLFGRDHEVLRRDHPVMSEDLKEELQGNSENSQPQKKQKMMQKP